MADVLMPPSIREAPAPSSRRKPGSSAVAAGVALRLSAKANNGDVPRPEGRRAWMHAVFRPSQDGESENPRDSESLRLPCRGSAFLLVTFLWQDKEKLPAALVAEAFAVAFASGGKGKGERQSPWIPAYAGMTAPVLPRTAGSERGIAQAS